MAHGTGNTLPAPVLPRPADTVPEDRISPDIPEGSGSHQIHEFQKALLFFQDGFPEIPDSVNRPGDSAVLFSAMLSILPMS